MMNSIASSSNSASSTELASLYECPVCFEFISPPILQCCNGHMVCSGCSPKLTGCPSCKAPLGTSRNLFMEKALSNVCFPCKFSTQGCQVTMLLADKSAHEGSCVLRPPPLCDCPWPLCAWKGEISQVVKHLSDKHPEITWMKGDKIVFSRKATRFSHADCELWIKRLKCDGQDFLFHYSKDEIVCSDDPFNLKFSVAVRLIGTKNEAENFTYRLTVRGHHHKLIWEGTPLSISDCLESAVENRDCLVFESTDLGGQLFSQDGSLDIQGQIKKNN